MPMCSTVPEISYGSLVRVPLLSLKESEVSALVL